MTRDDRLDAARRIMDWFAGSTGLEGEEPPRRYLWTDAFAVCNYLGLYQALDERRPLALAVRLVDQVHHVLGRFRDDDRRTGWISGLSEAEGGRHPTAGGLRIGKSRPERAPGEPYDPDAEWDRDGQYYHYLTRWMWALGRVSGVTGDPRYLQWAVELASSAHRAFVRSRAPGTPPSIHWKMSTDLERPLVASTGQHDALDGFVTLSALRAMEARMTPDRGSGTLARETTELEAMCRDGTWATADALGIGGLLTDGYRLLQLAAVGRPAGGGVLTAVLDQARWSLDAFDRTRALERPAEARLPFRELGLSIGLAAVSRMGREAASSHLSASPTAFEPLRRHLGLRGKIEAFWVESDHRRSATWTDHRDINSVMLATSLAPDGYLGM